MSLKRFLICFLVILSIGQNLFAQDGNNFVVSPYAGFSAPIGDFSNFSDNGLITGLSVDRYLSPNFAIGVDANYQNNGFVIPFDFSTLNSIAVTNFGEGNWSAATFSLGPTYRLNRGRAGLEFYLKGGLSMVTVPSQNTTLFAEGFENINAFNLNEEVLYSLGLTTGVRLNYNISERLSFFINPQFVVSGNEVEYFSRSIDQNDNPDIIAQDGGKLCYVRPMNLNLTAGVKISLGRLKQEDLVEESKEDLSKPELNIDDKDISLRIVSHEKGKTIKYSDKDKSIRFKWEIYGDVKRVKSYKLQIYQTDFWGNYGDRKEIIVVENQKKKLYDFKPSKTSRLSDKDIYYHFEVIGLDASEREVTNSDWRDLEQMTPPNPPPPSPCFEIIVSNVEINCDNPAYDQTTGWINYTGSVTIDNISDYYCGTQGLDGFFDVPPLPGLNWYNNTPGYNVSSGYMNGVAKDGATGNLIIPADWDWSWTNLSDSSIIIPSGGSVTVPITLQFRTVPGVVDFAVFGRGAGFTEVDGHHFLQDDIPDCICDPCETFEIAPDVSVNAITLDTNLYPSHSVLNIDQTIFAGPGAINNLKAELVFFEEILPDNPSINPQLFELDAGNNFHKKHLCQICNSAIDGLGVFNGNVTVNNQGASTPTTRVARWFFTSPLNMASGVSSNLQIGVPKVNPLDCCNPEYKFSIRYTFENEDCQKCDVLVDYHFQ